MKSYNQVTRKDARSKCYNCIEYIKKSIFQFICASIIRVACSASPLRLTSVRKSSPDVPFEPLRTALKFVVREVSVGSHGSRRVAVMIKRIAA